MSLETRRLLYDLNARAAQAELRVLRAIESAYRVLVTDRRWLTAASAAAEDFRAKKMYYYTGYFTYNAFLAIIALLVAMSALTGFLAGSANLSDDFLKTLKSVAPIFGATPKKTLDAMKAYRNVAGIVGIVGLMWTGTKIFGALEWGFCEIWGTKRRGYARKKVFGLLLISIIGLLFLAAFLVQFGFAAFWKWAADTNRVIYDTGTFVLKPVLGLAVNFLLFLVIYRIVPTGKRSFRDVAVGALVAAALFLGMQYLLAFYFGSISRVPSVYGSVSTVLILLIWLHLTGMITFFGAEIIYVTKHETLLDEHRRRASAWSFIPKSLRARAEDPDGQGRDERRN